MDELRFRSQQSPRNETSMNSLVSPPRNGMRQLPPPVNLRSSLPRRFTTDSGRVPILSSIMTQQRGPDPQDLSGNTAMHKVQLLEKKRLEYERLREQRRRFEAEMQKLDLAQRREEQELAAMQEDLGRLGHQSEPTTPPEYRESSSGFPTMFSRPNRYSASSLTSPPGLITRPNRSGSQLTSPGAGILQLRGFNFDDHLPSRSVPGSRRNSDEDEKEEAVRQDPTSHRSTNALNRYSMPVTRSRTGLYDATLDQTNTTRFLFGDDDGAGDGRNYGQVNNSDENFPILVRREEHPHMLSASSSTLDLAQADNPVPESNAASTWGNIHRHRPRQSLSTIGSAPFNGTSSVGQPGSASDATTLSGRPATARYAMEMKFPDIKFQNDGATDASGGMVSSPAGQVPATPPKLQSSYSANDVSMVKNTPGSSGLPVSTNNTHAQNYLHNHNASIGRIPAGAVPARHTREMSNENNIAVTRESAYTLIGSTLHGSATPFGPVLNQGPNGSNKNNNNNSNNAMTSPPAGGQFAGFYPNPVYGGNAGNQGAFNNMNGMNNVPMNGMNNVPMLAMSMQNMSLNGNPGAGSNGYHSANYTGYSALYAAPPMRDSQARVIQNRRQQDNEAMGRYTNLPLEQVGGTIYELCKDQHGCRYLQKQLENRNPEQIHMIWLETNQHVVELMTDPFGNYLCQKLLEFCNDEERTVLIQNAAEDMVRIALNQHGTRALQKMIEFVSTADQVQIITNALRFRVVELIQDLNGNHVIQKCLNKLSPADAQFIFDAVGNNCIEVGTHRHGCCVLQRCIDHASGDQKIWLVGKITENAVHLVQDPFGNYVVQYIIDLNEPTFTEPVVSMFQGRISSLSRHKFSSNVIEKCLRCAQDPSREMIAEELLSPGEMDRLLRDSFANYVIQTALEYAPPYMKHRMVESIRPILPNIRSTPYGRRIQGKIQAYDSRSGPSSGQITPADGAQGQIPLRQGHARGMSNNTTSILSPGGFANGAGMNGGMGRAGVQQQQQQGFAPSNVMTVPSPAHVQPPHVQQQFGAAAQQFGRTPMQGPAGQAENGDPAFF